MAVTRREFITTLGMLATAVGLGEADLAKVTEAFAHGGAWNASGFNKKPKVIWVHGAECTGCSVGLLSLFEDATGVAVPGLVTGQALGFIASGALPTANAPVNAAGLVPNVVTSLSGHRTLETAGVVDGSAYAVNIADVLIDFIDLQYHETIGVMGGDGAYAYLSDQMVGTTNPNEPYVLVVEGAVQPTNDNGYWNASGTLPWCSIAADGTANAAHELAFPDIVSGLAGRAACAAVVAIGQCASFGGYPACKGPDLVNNSHGKSMTGAHGVYDFLKDHTSTGAHVKVINSPGCPTNPWWFTLTVVAWMVDAVAVTSHKTGANFDGAAVLGVLQGGAGGLAINTAAVDGQRRLLAVYGDLLHSKYCPRYPWYANNVFATNPGDDGCLKNLGCKGLSTMSSCGRHGWNNAQPQNTGTLANFQTAPKINEAGVVSGSISKTPPLYTNTDHLTLTETAMGGCCLTAGAPCMGCTEKGYPDAMTPFVVR